MKRLYIVEDEKLIRKGIRAIAERSGVVIEEITEFRNGQEAYEACLDQLPDLMITDIRMPKMDGISLVQRLKEEKKLPRTLVISGHDDFEYARTMLRCGARDYVLKPVEREKVISLLQQMEQEIAEEEVREKQTRSLLIEQIQERMNGRENLSQVIQTKQLAEALFLKDYQGDEVIACCVSKLHFEEEENWVFHTDEGHCFCLIPKQELTEKLFASVPKEYAGCSKPFRVVNEIGTACEAARIERIRSYFMVCGRESLERYLQEAAAEGDRKEIKQGSMTDGSGGFLSWQEEESSKEIENLMPYIRKIGSGQPEQARSYIEDCYRRLIRNKISPVEWMRYMYSFARGLNRFYSELPLPDGDGLLKPYQFHTAEAYYRRIYESIEEVHTFMEENSEDYKNRLKIAEAVSYIQAHFASDLNMAVVSNHIGMSYNWFSSVFKQYTGSNFVTYLRKIRMEEAKKLLAGTELKIQEVSIASGYENEIHFMKCFKTEFGISPTEYRKSMLLQTERKDQ